MTADHLISADVILGDALETWDASLNSKLSPTIQNIRENYADAIKQTYPKSWRNSSGYRLNYLLPWSPSIPSRWDVNDYGLTSSVYRPSSTVGMLKSVYQDGGTTIYEVVR